MFAGLLVRGIRNFLRAGSVAGLRPVAYPPWVAGP